MASSLLECLNNPSNRADERTAVEDPATGRSITYGELRRSSDRLRDRLQHLGVGRGDRVGFCLEKSIDSIVSVFGILECGAAYVPIDATAPVARSATILDDCRVRALITDSSRAEGLRAALDELAHRPPLLVLEPEGDALPMVRCLDALDAVDPAAPGDTLECAADDLAYILYTSGSTGRPKGVMLTHLNGKSFVDWCSGVFEPSADDRFSSHAPLHFDLSILDLFVPLRHGATLVLVPEGLSKDPIRLAPFIEEQRLTCWYSTPSILGLLPQYGKLELRDLSSLRLVSFAGEVFPIKHLRALHEKLPGARYFNLYGPTETNVCTYFELPREIPDDRTEPFPIGRPCSHCECRVLDRNGSPVAPGDEGELVVRGASVTRGYWNLPERTAESFHTDAEGRAWYRTGDLVIENEDGDYIFRGRRDRMIKKRGYRIELGEIEACLYRHPEIEEVAVVASSDGGDVRVTAVLTLAGGPKPSIIALKTFCSERIPAYMIPDRFVVEDRLPRTSTDKVDYQALSKSLS